MGIKAFWSRHGSTILTTVGIVATIATPIVTAWAVPKALAAVEAAKEKKGDELTPVEKIKAAGPLAIAPVATTAVAVGCTVAGKKMDLETIKLLTTTCNKIIDQKSTFESVAQEKLGAKKFDEIKSESDARCEPKQIESTTYTETGYGDALFKDKFSGQVFKCSMEHIRSVENDLNEILFNNEDVYLAEYYTRLGLEQVNPHLGWEWGWSVERMYESGSIRKINIKVTHAEQLPDGTPVGVVSFGCDSEPKALKA